MRILLINICNPNSQCFRGKYSQFLTYPALTLAHIKAIIKLVDSEIEIDTCDEFAREQIDFSQKYDIVMMSFMSIGAYRAYEIATKFKELGSYTVAGGYHPTYVLDEVQEYFDTTIVGSANGSIPMFLNDFKNNQPQKTYINIPELSNFEIIPDRSAIPKKKYIKIPPVIANPSCPNCCQFCVISDSNRLAKPRNLETVRKELKMLNSKKVIFLDPNFFANKEYSLELMNILKELKIEWSAACTINLVKDESLLKKAVECGALGFAVGLESFSKESLLDVNKGFNKPEEYKKAIEKFHKFNLYINGFIIVGMDYDTKDSLMNIPQMVEYLHLDLAKYAILTPMPNSELYYKLESENRILTKNWNYYDQNHVVFQPKNMTPDELTNIYLYIWNETYKFSRMRKRIFKGNQSFSNKLILFGANLAFKHFGINEELKNMKES